LMSAVPPITDIRRRDWDVCFVPKAEMIEAGALGAAASKP
jgi:hypothetical protein